MDMNRQSLVQAYDSLVFSGFAHTPSQVTTLTATAPVALQFRRYALTINLLSALGIPLSQLWVDTPALNATHARLDIKVYESSSLLFDPLPDFSNFVEIPSYLNIDAGT